MFRVILCCCVISFSAIAAARADQLRLSNGDMLNVTIVEQSAESVTFEHPTLGRMTVPAESVTVNPPEPVAVAANADASQPATTPTPAAAPSPPPAPPEPEPLHLSLFGVPIMEGWQRRFEFSADASRGNSDSTSIRVGFDGRYEDLHKRWIVESDYYRATANSETNTNKFNFDLTRDWLVPDRPWFYFVKTRYDYDDFVTYRHRATASAGIGYQFVKREDLDLLLRVGGGGSYAWDAKDDDIPDEFTPEGLIGLEGVWRVQLIYPLEFRNTFYPDLEDGGEYRNISEVSFMVPIDAGKNMYLKLGLENEYDSYTPDDTKHNDVRYAASLVVDF